MSLKSSTIEKTVKPETPALPKKFELPKEFASLKLPDMEDRIFNIDDMRSLTDDLALTQIIVECMRILQSRSKNRVGNPNAPFLAGMIVRCRCIRLRDDYHCLLSHPQPHKEQASTAA